MHEYVVLFRLRRLAAFNRRSLQTDCGCAHVSNFVGICQLFAVRSKIHGGPFEKNKFTHREKQTKPFRTICFISQLV